MGGVEHVTTEREREREFIQGDIVLLQTHSDNTAIVEQKFTKYKKLKPNIKILTIISPPP